MDIIIFMKPQENKRFFKMVALQNSRFVKDFDISEIDEIYPGRQFTAKGKPYEWCQWYSKSGNPNPKVSLQTNVPMIHFSDNTIDLLMWYYVGMRFSSPYQEVYFFEIKPMSQVHKQRCNDKNNLYQCGAQRIEIVQQVTMGDIFRIANQEIQNNTDEIINRYPDKNMLKLIMHVQNNIIRKR